MLRLIFRELVFHRRAWTGTLLACSATAFVIAAVLNVQEALSALPSVDFESFAFPIIALTVLTGATVVANAVSMALVSLRKDIALLSLGGLLPRQAAVLVGAQVVILAALSGVVGAGAAALISPWLTDVIGVYVLQVGKTPSGSPCANPMLAIAIVIVTAGLATLNPARKASRYSPLDGLREAPTSTRAHRMTAVRWVIAAGSASLAALAFFTNMLFGPATAREFFPPSSPEEDLSTTLSAISGGGLLLVVSLAGLLAALSPLIVPGLTRAWTALIPHNAHPSWFIARRNALLEPSRSTSATTPIALGIGMISGVVVTLELTSSAFALASGTSGAPGPDVSILNIMTILFGPLLLSFIAAILVNLIDFTKRQNDVALYQISGASVTVQVTAGVLESAIYSISACVFGTLMTGLCAFLVLIAISHEQLDIVPSLPMNVLGVGAAIGFVFVGTTLLIITGLAFRRSPIALWKETT